MHSFGGPGIRFLDQVGLGPTESHLLLSPECGD